MPQMTICIGNIGSGKSLLASKLAKMGHMVVDMDLISTMFGGGEYGLYDSKKKGVYHDTETCAIESALENGFSVVVDRTNMDRKRRRIFLEIGKKYAAKIVAYDWGAGDASEVNRRIKTPHGISSLFGRAVQEIMKIK